MWNRYQYNGKSIGYKDGPDVQSIKAFVSYLPLRNLKTDFSFEYDIKGNNFLDTKWVFPSTNIYWYKTPIGVEPVSKWFLISFNFE